MILFYILMILSFVTLSMNGIQWIFRFDIYNANYISFSFVSTLLYMFTQTLIMFYFIGAGKKIKETIIYYDLDKETYQEVIALKRILFNPLCLNMLFVGTTFILGGGVHTGSVSKNWHLGLFLVSIIHYLKLLFIQHSSFVENAKILSKVGKELELSAKNKES